MKLNCENSHSLVPSYLDGQLPEAQAAPLRAHLIECPSCREVAKEGKSLKRWFNDDSTVYPGTDFFTRIGTGFNGSVEDHYYGFLADSTTAGISVAEVRMLRPSLDAVFLHHTGRRLADRTDGAGA